MLTLTVQTGQSVAAKDKLANAGTLKFGETPEDDDLYEVYFELKNSDQEQAGKPVTITTSGFDDEGIMDSGLAASRRTVRPVVRRAGHGGKGDLVFEFTPKEDIVGGESIILELPHYETSGSEGPLFGITSSSKAFTTYADRSDWELHGTSQSKARAVFTQGYVASGVSSSKRSSTKSGLDGFFMLASKDDGITENKHVWFSEGTSGRARSSLMLLRLPHTRLLSPQLRMRVLRLLPPRLACTRCKRPRRGH